MANWQYKIINSKDAKKEGGNVFASANRSEIEGWLNSFGDQGWEIINLDFEEELGEAHFFGIMKKQK